MTLRNFRGRHFESSKYFAYRKTLRTFRGAPVEKTPCMKIMQDLNRQMSSALSYHQSSVSYSYPSSSPIHRNSTPFIETPYKPHSHGSYASSMNIRSPQTNHLKGKGGALAPGSILSYSAAAKKAGDVPQVVLTDDGRYCFL